ncbi:hypothetical protein B842_00735 [Corynebacterium humireducens NBRC 106098 = DSM 45392]|uniref:Restriction endonuclease type II-like domain-containing protein n=1 Tax=Corynebacterium humireducens NBRC 106098 = DSM 45392 TaxID=1223515 RepID=A0A0B5D6P4_9CORY|nr:DUF559 domain-containing protein [Corynebacterium humireducens]AJE32003.1 hypothetical protein B842_00735 [Corynebacterium humireducens NBRC 106098 = DSM 45392]
MDFGDHTVVDSALLRGRGLTQRQIERLVANGHLHRVEQGLFTTRKPEGLLLLQALCHRRPNLVFTGRTALELRRDQPLTLPVQALVPRGRSSNSTPLLQLRRRKEPRFRQVRGLRLALPAVSVADADDLPDGELIAYLESEFAGHQGKRQLEAEVACMPRVPGRFRALVSRASIGADSEAERQVARALSARGLRVEQNVLLGGYYFDILLPTARVIVEIDGFRYHSAERRETFVRDRWKANYATRHGYRVLRYSGSCVRHHPEEIVAQVVAAVEGLAEELDTESTPVWEWHDILTGQPPVNAEMAQ